jgi:2-polyprenyl-6-methoxyphenol hydroxylase-like FAD-dependent oxidoreductase
VLIVGGGIGGLCAAIALRRAGIEATVFERQPALGEVGAGLCLWPNAMHVLRRLGLAEQLYPLGCPVEGQENRAWEGRVLERHSFAAVPRDLGVPALTIHRADLQAVLLANMARDGVRLGMRCTGFEIEGDGVMARFADGTSARGACLIGADGIHSAVRAQVLGPEPPRYAGYTCCRGVVAYQPGWFPPGWFVQGLGDGVPTG